MSDPIVGKLKEWKKSPLLFVADCMPRMGHTKLHDETQGLLALLVDLFQYLRILDHDELPGLVVPGRRREAARLDDPLDQRPTHLLLAIDPVASAPVYHPGGVLLGGCRNVIAHVRGPITPWRPTGESGLTRCRVMPYVLDWPLSPGRLLRTCAPG